MGLETGDPPQEAVMKVVRPSENQRVSAAVYAAKRNHSILNNSMTA